MAWQKFWCVAGDVLASALLATRHRFESSRTALAALAIAMYSLDDNRKIGIGLSTAGILFTILGIFMFFDRGLLAMGNVRSRIFRIAHPDSRGTHMLPVVRAQLLFLSGVLLIIGPAKTYRFFFQKRKAKGTACFLGGIALVLYGWAMVGIIVEGWGFLNLFGDFFPTALGFLRNMPVIGNVLSLPVVRSVTDRLVTKSRLPV